jgi:Transposase IS116/IS110/IS902 family
MGCTPSTAWPSRPVGSGDQAARDPGQAAHTTLARLDALLELLGPGWLTALGVDLANKTPLRLLAAGYADPHTLKRLGTARLARFSYRHSRGAWGDAHAQALLAAATQTLSLWDGELDYAELADDRRRGSPPGTAPDRGDQGTRRADRGAGGQARPDGIITSAPGVAQITGAQILGRLGDPNRFDSLAGVRAFSGLVPSLTASGVTGKHGGPTKAGDAVLRQALFLAADHARRLDPTLAARYHRLMVQAGKHHNSAVCHIATAFLTRMVACRRRGERYVVRDLDGREVTLQEARRIIAERSTIPPDRRRQANTSTRPRSTGRAGEARSRKALRRPARPLPTLRHPARLDTG